MTENDELKAQIAALEERLAKLEERGRPSATIKSTPGPLRDLTAGASMPPSALREMANAVGDVVIREIVSGDRVRAELAPLARGNVGPPTPAHQNRSGYRNAAPLDVPGIALADRLMDAADKADRAELVQRLAKQELARRAKADDAA